MRKRDILVIIIVFVPIILVVIHLWHGIKKADIELERFNVDKKITIDSFFNYKIGRLNNDKKEEFDKVFNNYMDKKYGNVRNSFKVEYKGVDFHNGGDDSLIVRYDIQTLFMKERFRVVIGYDTLKILKDNFIEVLSSDPKFLHLYSEWVKKQVGIEDENVELRFTSKPVIISDLDNAHIDFDKVLKLSDDYKEIFENTKNLYCYKILIKNYADSKNFNINEYVKQLKIKYLDPAMEYTNRKAYSNIGYIYIYTKNSDKALYCFICENNEIRPFGKK